MASNLDENLLAEAKNWNDCVYVEIVIVGSEEVEFLKTLMLHGSK